MLSYEISSRLVSYVVNHSMSYVPMWIMNILPFVSTAGGGGDYHVYVIQT